MTFYQLYKKVKFKHAALNKSRLLRKIAKLERVGKALKKEHLEIRDFILPALESTQPLLDSRHQTFSLELPAEHLWVDGDRILMAQILANLLNNACKFTPEHGSIKLTVEACAESIYIRVADNGLGFDHQSLARLLDFFYPADNPLGRSQGGLDIGLSLVKNLVEQHGGLVQVFSAGLGLGSEFLVRLPRVMLSNNLSVDSAQQIAIPHINLRILVVDDSPDVAESLAMLLEMDGHEILIAYDGQEALEMAQIELPDAILLDIGLPGMDGYAVANALRQLSVFQGTLLLAVTGYGQPEDLEKSRRAGFDNHLVKPIDYAILRRFLADYQTVAPLSL